MNLRKSRGFPPGEYGCRLVCRGPNTARRLPGASTAASQVPLPSCRAEPAAAVPNCRAPGPRAPRTGRPPNCLASSVARPLPRTPSAAPPSARSNRRAPDAANCRFSPISAHPNCRGPPATRPKLPRPPLPPARSAPNCQVAPIVRARQVPRAQAGAHPKFREPTFRAPNCRAPQTATRPTAKRSNCRTPAPQPRAPELPPTPQMIPCVTQ